MRAPSTAVAGDPYDSAVQQVIGQVQSAVADSVGLQAVPSNLTPSLADVPPPQAAPQLTQYQRDLMRAGTVGPASVPLKDQAVLSLPSDAVFLPQGPAKTLMQRMGNQTDENFIGLILPWQESDWFITLEFIPAGYVADDDANFAPEIR